MAITITQLWTFVAVEHVGSIKGAAAELVVTQPSVSGAISALEKELGVSLVERRGRGVGLTEAGVAFAPFATRALGLLQEGRAVALEAADPEHQKLKIAAVNTAGEYIVPPVLQAFRYRYPRTDVRLGVSNRAGVLRQVELREADVGIGGSPPESGAFDGIPFLDNELVVVISPEHPLACRQGVAFEDLEMVTWLLRENGSGTRIFTDNLLVEKGIKPPSTMTVGSNGAIKQSVRAGLGISLQSRRAVELELAMGLLSEVDLDEKLPLRRWYALYPKDGPGRPIVQTFLKFLTDDAARKAIADSLVIPGKDA